MRSLSSILDAKSAIEHCFAESMRYAKPLLRRMFMREIMLLFVCQPSLKQSIPSWL